MDRMLKKTRAERAEERGGGARRQAACPVEPEPESECPLKVIRRKKADIRGNRPHFGRPFAFSSRKFDALTALAYPSSRNSDAYGGVKTPLTKVVIWLSIPPRKPATESHSLSDFGDHIPSSAKLP